MYLNTYEIATALMLIVGIIMALILKRWIVFGMMFTMSVALSGLYLLNKGQAIFISIVSLFFFYYVDNRCEIKRLEKEAKIKDYYNSPYYKQTNNDYIAMVRTDIGRYGEYLVFDELKSLESEGVKFIFNAYIPRYDGTTSEIDVVLITKSGLFVVESKNYSGWIFGDQNSKMWMQTLEYGYKNRFYNPIWQNRTHCNYLKKYLKINDSDLVSYIVFSDRCEFRRIPDNTEAYRIIHRGDLLNCIKSDMKRRGDKYPQSTVSNFYNALFPLTQTDNSIKQKHIDDIKKRSQS